ncbi:phosphotransferase family protein [Virgibacillus doumboii]|uniref:phosphotransferase family protein n=1 Tax=Virgibacillus doumboii TaxID=2697503 RepID=UPI0013DEEA7D|nr:aminoglycoside phosphotransferase family protein [Virgibacillus doumboii]
MEIEQYTDRINQVYPDLSIEKVEKNETGQNNDVLIINDSLVFRFPKYKAGIDKLYKETKILGLIKKGMKIHTPDPIYQSFDKLEVGKVFTGYPMIEGHIIRPDEFSNVEDKPKLDIRSLTLVNFLIRLHAYSKKDLPDESVPIFDEYKELFEKIQLKLYPYMRDDAKNEVSTLFEDFFERIDDFHFTPTLIHGDFGASNILWDGDNLQLTGVIDFGESGFGDPAYDFAGILASYGYDFFKLCIGHYFDDPEIEKRAVFYQKTFALQEALHGIENGDELAFSRGIQGYT